MFTSYKDVKKIQTPIFSYELSKTISEKEAEEEQKKLPKPESKFHIESIQITPKYFEGIDSYFFLSGNFYGDKEPENVEFIVDLGRAYSIKYDIIPKENCNISDSDLVVLKVKCHNIKLLQPIHIYSIISQPIFASIAIKYDKATYKKDYNDYLSNHKLQLFEEPDTFFRNVISFIIGGIISFIFTLGLVSSSYQKD